MLLLPYADIVLTFLIEIVCLHPIPLTGDLQIKAIICLPGVCALNIFLLVYSNPR